MGGVISVLRIFSKREVRLSTPFFEMGKKTALTSEEELLLQDYSRHVSKKSSLLFYGNALVVSVLPIWIFWRIHSMDPVNTFVSTWLLAFAYRNTKFLLKHKVAQRREEAIMREMNKKLADDKKMNKKEKDDRTLWKKNEVSDYEATTLSIFYNNALFLMVVICTSFYVFRGTGPVLNYCVSFLLAAGLSA